MTALAIDALLARRVGWGAAVTIDELLDPDGHGIPAATDPWDGLDLTPPPRPGPGASTAEKQQARRVEREQSEAAIGAWLDHLVATPRPLEDWMVWFWHGHFVSGLDKVKSPHLLVQQLRMFRRFALAPFPELVRSVTVDPAMLVYLDGASSTGTAPNENYARELLELFTLGVDNYSENDVKAGARALTGWTIDKSTGNARFAPRRHDDTPQRYLGTPGVHDVDSVVDAVVAQPSCATFAAGEVARAVLGPVSDDVVREIAAPFATSGLDTRVLLRTILDALSAGHGEPMTLAPVPWLVAAQRVTGAAIASRARLGGLKSAGQLPLLPPNVAGWPSGAAWFGASTIVARYQMASAIAQATPTDNAVFVAASDGDVDALASILLRPNGFSDATRAALHRERGNARNVVQLALASPDLAVA